MADAPLEIVDVFDDRAAAFLERGRREAFSTCYGFRVVWHEQTQDLIAQRDGATAGALRAHIAASLAWIDELTVLPDLRRRGIGSALLERLREIAIYYNCHKITVQVPHKSAAQAFFESNGYKVEAVLAQHVFKLDVAVMRKFLL